MSQEEIDRLREKVAQLKREVRSKDDILHRKNLELDALGHVWCSGGCNGGVYRYDEDMELTEQQVRMIENNTIRLRHWFENKRCRKAQEAQTPLERCAECASKKHCFKEENP